MAKRTKKYDDFDVDSVEEITNKAVNESLTREQIRSIVFEAYAEAENEKFLTSKQNLVQKHNKYVKDSDELFKLKKVSYKKIFDHFERGINLKNEISIFLFLSETPTEILAIVQENDRILKLFKNILNELENRSLGQLTLDVRPSAVEYFDDLMITRFDQTKQESPTQYMIEWSSSWGELTMMLYKPKT
jgi:hypothetical protein